MDVRFYRSASADEPVRVWLMKEVSAEARKAIGGDIKTVQLGWPMGMPLVRKMDDRLWEVRSSIPEGIARVMFTTVKQDMVLLHGFVKKSPTTPKTDLALAKKRRDEVIK
ncbi:type II toxin-antitoxin system RelE/ParE family toxin [Stenotrophomonas maltophilia]|uniref:type II toxin-antitoxin system RelE/ParE family toxin n=2 Tax=Stenotrophomonas maltophilia TaxID=40324 RepID=UPI001E4DE3B0|nr:MULTISPECIES: type II toxin-antitoxin system RelE/ParE family toxin [Stenotrophomonas]MCO7497680.1 type II toxin-antitoxin system RelE/ParE family toxin [Stenotrophomonas maltophilia]MDZ5774755.1 type II toxin-antitoxin system RelE/ParE family toxin [Stenotrophomonas maltophilia]